MLVSITWSRNIYNGKDSAVRACLAAGVRRLIKDARQDKVETRRVY